MLVGLLWTLLGLVGLAAALLAVPVEVVARFDFGARTQAAFRIAWLFGVVRLRPGIGARKPGRPARPKRRRKRRGAGMPSRAVIRRGIGLFGKLLGRVQLRRAELDLLIGTDDPAATGELVGFTAPIVAMANALPRTRVALRPDFTGPRFEGAGEGEIRVVPLTLLPPIIGFALSSEMRRWLFSRR